MPSQPATCTSHPSISPHAGMGAVNLWHIHGVSLMFIGVVHHYYNHGLPKAMIFVCIPNLLCISMGCVCGPLSSSWPGLIYINQSVSHPMYTFSHLSYSSLLSSSIRSTVNQALISIISILLQSLCQLIQLLLIIQPHWKLLGHKPTQGVLFTFLCIATR